MGIRYIDNICISANIIGLMLYSLTQTIIGLILIVGPRAVWEAGLKK